MTDKELQLISQANREVKQHHEKVESDDYRLRYHIMPPVGLLNDPNGFIQSRGVYHLFYQWNPFKTGHGAKFWGHYTSKNLVDWTHEKIALAPGNWFDKNGCYSGSAVYDEGKIKLFYTGNVKDEFGNRETYQCLAESEDGLNFTKKGVVVNLPEGYTAHFRDPKVWEYEGNWYMIVGGQSFNKQGKAVLFRSVDLKSWQLLGDITGSHTEQLGEFGYMWECPDLFSLGGKDVLLVSPQGLKPNGILYNNQYQSGYFVGELNYKTAKMTHGEFVELDRGFEFYAPQTTVDEQGRRLLFAWMGVPDQDEDKHPTIDHNWIHAMTIPRQLILKGERLYQKPPEELEKLRNNKVFYENVSVEERGQSFPEISGEAIELIVKVEQLLGDVFEITIRGDTKIIFNRVEGLLTLERKAISNRHMEARHCKLIRLEELHIFLDTSSIEIFVNGGEEVFTARIFPEKENRTITFKATNGTVECSLLKWQLG